MHLESMPSVLARARGLLPAGASPAATALLLHQARVRARARGLPPTARVVLKMLADLQGGANAR